jgi:hypothetical protein
MQNDSTTTSRRSLEERLENPAEAWRPDPGEKLIGTVVDLDERESTYDEQPYPIVTVLTSDGNEHAFHGFHTVPRRELARLRPRLGERIGIVYHGRHPRGYEHYTIKLERDPTAPDWERIAAAAGEPTDEDEQQDEDDGIPY